MASFQLEGYIVSHRSNKTTDAALLIVAHGLKSFLAFYVCKLLCGTCSDTAAYYTIAALLWLLLDLAEHYACNVDCIWAHVSIAHAILSDVPKFFA